MIRFWSKKPGSKEIQLRIQFLNEFESVWSRLWDYRFGQLIENLFAAARWNRPVYRIEQLTKLDTLQWLELLRTVRLEGDHRDVEFQKMNTVRQPDRIPIAMAAIKKEWLNSKYTFGEYVLRCKEQDRPGGTLYGYEYNHQPDIHERDVSM